VLWSISPSLVYFLLLYTGFGTTALTWVFGRPLMRLYYKSLNSEADMRFSLVRVRENAESIAFYGGEGRERQVGGQAACLPFGRAGARCRADRSRRRRRHCCEGAVRARGGARGQGRGAEGAARCGRRWSWDGWGVW
jgi:hypothetical protein